MAEVLLTADRTLMSDYHNNIFLGFGTCAPKNIIPEWLYSFLFFPRIRSNNGVPLAAPYGLRKVEAQLLKEEFNVKTVTPNSIHRHIKSAKILGIHTMDPFGLGPASSTLSAIFKKKPYLARHFQELIDNPVIKQAQKRGLKIVIGGPGAWQFHYREDFVERQGIDCIIEGEAENILGKIFRALFNGNSVPIFYQTPIKETPTLDEIPDIVSPSIDGLVEIGRGCCRGCEFCNVTIRPLRWNSLNKIRREVDLNLSLNKANNCCLHAEDVMLYGSRNTTPDGKKLVKLHELVVAERKVDLSWSHCSIAAIAAKPKLLSKISEMVLQNQAWWGAEVGIETGSPEIVKKRMPAKAHPFKAEDWPQIVHEAMGLMHDNNLVPACTLILGLPQETEDDILKTMELIDNLKEFRSLIVPLFFVPLGQLSREDWFKSTNLSDLHKQLMFQCVEHDFYWADRLIDSLYKNKWQRRLLKPFYKAFVAIAKSKVRQIE